MLSARGDVFSFVRRDTLEHIEVVDGQVVEKIAEQDEVEPDPNEIPNSKYELRDSERHHFQSATLSLKELVAQYRDILFSLASRNIVGPKLVSHYLNASSRRTASGASWTPRLAFFLIALTEAPTEKSPIVRPRRQRSQNQPSRSPSTSPQKSKKTKKPREARSTPNVQRVLPVPVDPVPVADLPKLQQDLDKFDALMLRLQQEREYAWFSEKKRQAITQQFHSVKKKRDQLWQNIERLKRM
ncbi:hypothetical protein [Gemmobacter lutimaris]|uniref:hypothetical protein n=1 Tax=Gemmobacter lutimaris TaxID=2306023 RepID=UPI0011C3A85F|nr:hypothetical protein [Gemmobacter lutimaris]